MRRILFVVVLCWAQSSFATDYYYGGQAAGHYSTPGGACASFYPTSYPDYAYDHVALKDAAAFSYNCYGKRAADGLISNNTYVQRAGTSCAAGTSFDLTSGACLTACPASGTGGGWYSYSGAAQSSLCINGCSYNTSNTACVGGACASDSFSAAAFCQTNTPGLTSEPPPNAPPCPVGTVNIGTGSGGVPICSGVNATPSTTPPTTTSTPKTVTNGDGSTTQTTTTSATNKDGSTTTTTTTTNTSSTGNVTTTSSSVTGAIPAGLPGAGGAGNSTQTPDDKGDLCKQHPELNICKNSSVGGTCGQIACDGDAIQCAMLRSQQKQYCENTTDDANSTAGKAIMAGNDPLKSTYPTPANGVTVTMPSSLSSTSFLGSACLPDKSFSLQGKAFVIPYNAACEYLVPFRYALMFVVLMLSFRMVSGVVFRET